MPKVTYKWNKRINRRFPQDEGDYDEPLIRENLPSRDGRLKSVAGTEDFGIIQNIADPYTAFLYHCNNEGPVETGQSLTFNGETRIDTTQYKFGSGSIYFDGTGDNAVMVDGSIPELSNLDFTLETWVMFNALVTTDTFISKWTAGGNKSFVFQCSHTTHKLLFYHTTDGTTATFVSGTWTPTTGIWYHIVCQRTSTGKVMFFVNGARIDNDAQSIGADTIYHGTSAISLGAEPDLSEGFKGWMDEVRISVGIARYPSTGFTVQTSEFSIYTTDVVLTDIITWAKRYYTLELGNIGPKTFLYTKDGKLWVIDDSTKIATMINDNLNKNAYPNSWLFKTGLQTIMYFADGLNLYSYDGNNDNNFIQVDFKDADGNPLKPIDLIEHKDRNCVISETSLFISKNLDFSVFNDPNDSIEIIVGSGKGKNLGLCKLNEYLFILNTEGIFILYGDTISALAATFSIKLMDEHRIVAFRSAQKVERSIIFLAAHDKNIELWSFDGSSCKMLSYLEMITNDINHDPEMLQKACSTYYNNYYMVSVVGSGSTYNNIEYWYDTLEDKIEIIKGRNVSCYMQTDPIIETCIQYLGRSDSNKLMIADRGRTFDGQPIIKNLRTKDITIGEGENVRFTAFYPGIDPTGNRNMMFRYLLDGRLSAIDSSDVAYLNLEGESKGLGYIKFNNQNQFTDRIQPKINYARGTSLAIEIYDATPDMEFEMCNFTIEFIGKGKKKAKKVGA